jgi:hypothetical protein
MCLPAANVVATRMSERAMSDSVNENIAADEWELDASTKSSFYLQGAQCTHLRVLLATHNGAPSAFMQHTICRQTSSCVTNNILYEILFVLHWTILARIVIDHQENSNESSLFFTGPSLHTSLLTIKNPLYSSLGHPCTHHC